MVRALLDLVGETYTAWRQDRTIRLGAGIAYYSLFAIVPFLAFTVAFAGELFGNSNVEEYLTDALDGLAIDNSDELAQEVNDQLNRTTVESSLGIFGLGSLLFASSLLFLALSDAVRTIWDVPVHAGLKATIRRRLISFLMVLVVVGVVIVGFAISAVAGAAQALMPDVALVEDLAHIVTGTASSVALTGALVLMFRFLGPTRVPWRYAVGAAITTAVLMAVASALIAWYLRNYGAASLAGAFGSLLAMLTLVYIEAQILLAGVQLTKVLTLR